MSAPSAEQRSRPPLLLSIVVGLLLVAVIGFLIWWLLVRDDEQQAAPLVPAGEVTLSAETLDFGDEQVGWRSATQTVVLTNGTTGAVRVEDTAVDGQAGEDFPIAESSCQSARLDPGDSCAVAIRFTPAEPGVRSGELVLALDGGPGEQTVELRGSGIGSATIVVGATRLDFGEHPLDAKGDAREVALTNVGELPARVNRVAVTGPAAADFRPSRKVGCLASRTIEPGAACVVRVTFIPSEPGPRTATLLVGHTGEASPARIQLLGAGEGEAVLALAPGELRFGEVEVGAAGEPQSVSVSNAGSAPLELAWVAVAAGDAGDFELLEGGCAVGATLEPGAACSVRVRFAPESGGPHSAALVVAAEGVFAESALRGTASEPPVEQPLPTISGPTETAP